MKDIMTMCLLAVLVGCQVQSGPSIPVKKQTEIPGWQATKYMLGAYSAPSKLVEERTISDDETAFSDADDGPMDAASIISSQR
jgi:hypothetical protein